MPALTLASPSTSAPGPWPDVGRRRRFLLETTPAPDVPVRVLMMLRRRGCHIVAVDFVRADLHRPGHLAITLEAPPRVGHRLEEWLRSLVDVLAVRCDDDRAR